MGLGVHFLFVFGIFALFSIPRVHADTALEAKRYSRCYERFASARVPESDPNLIAVKAGTQTGVTACGSLLTSAAIGANNQVTSDAAGLNRKILRKLHEVHRGFVSAPEYYGSIDPNNTASIIDGYEVANAFTYYLLKPGTTFSKILTEAVSYQGIRDGGVPTRKFMFPEAPLEILDVNGTAYHSSPSAVLVKEGNLLGVGPTNPINSYPPKSGTNGLDKGSQTILSDVVTNNMNANLGAGLIGTQSYVLSSDVNYGMLQNGGTLLRRRWMKSVIKDFLCRDLPVIRSGDFPQAEVVTTAGALPFRLGPSCVQCHSSMDKGASIARGLTSIKSTFADDNHIGMGFVANRKSTLSSSSVFPVADETEYYLKKPEGYLFFRDYNGVLVNQTSPLNGLPALALKLSEQDQFYACVASKYYKFLTGISVNLDDLNGTTLSSGAQFHRQKVIDLGQSLKASSNTSGAALNALILSIVGSDAFVKPYQGQ